MSDETTPTPGAQTAGQSDAGTQSSGQPDAGAQTQAVQAQPFKTFATEAELQNFTRKTKSQAERAALHKLAVSMGFQDAEELTEALEPLRRVQGGIQPGIATQPATPQGPSEADRLRMALNIGAKLNLPASLVSRLQGTTPEEMEADAQTLVSLLGQGGQRSPGIPGAPQSGQPVTFTRSQLQDAKFVREHADEIRQAAREGRIVNS